MSAAAATVLIAAAAVFASPEVKQKAAVAMIDEAPVTVAGRGFARGERVTVRAIVGGRSYTRVVRASVAGRFRARFGTASAECAPYVISAVGRSSGRAAGVRRIEIPPPCGIDPQP